MYAVPVVEHMNACQACGWQEGDSLHVLLGSGHRSAQRLEEACLAFHIIQVAAPPEELSHLIAPCGTQLSADNRDSKTV